MRILKRKELEPDTLTNLVLLGDSVFGNTTGLGEGQTVVEQMNAMLPEKWSAQSLAEDMARIADVHAQVDQPFPENTRYIFLSVGGRNVIDLEPLIFEKYSSASDLLVRLYELRDTFQDHYASILDLVLEKKLKTAVTTMYTRRGRNRTMTKILSVVFNIFNDAIIQCALRRGVPVIDMKSALNDYHDYVDTLRPSAQGARKIAKTLLKTAYTHDFNHRVSAMYTWKRGGS